MIRTCDGMDPNLTDEQGEPCKCGLVFDDVEYTVVYPHSYIPTREEKEAIVKRLGEQIKMSERLRWQSIEEVADELIRQEKIWGEQNHSDYYWLTILIEEVGEAAMAILAPEHNANPRATGEHHDHDFRKEVIQIAAVAINWAEAIKRRELNAESG